MGLRVGHAARAGVRLRLRTSRRVVRAVAKTRPAKTTKLSLLGVQVCVPAPHVERLGERVGQAVGVLVVDLEAHERPALRQARLALLGREIARHALDRAHREHDCVEDRSHAQALADQRAGRHDARAGAVPRQRPARGRDAAGVVDPHGHEHPHRRGQRDRRQHAARAREAPPAPTPRVGRRRGARRRACGRRTTAPAMVGARNDGHRHGARADHEQEPGGDLDVGLLAEHPREALAARPREQPEGHEGQRATGAHSSSPSGRPDPQPQQPRPALEVGGEPVGDVGLSPSGSTA